MFSIVSAEVGFALVAVVVTLRVIPALRSVTWSLLYGGASAAVAGATPFLGTISLNSATALSLMLLPSIAFADFCARRVATLIIIFAATLGLFTIAQSPGWVAGGLLAAVAVRLSSRFVPIADLITAAWAVAIFRDIGIIAVFLALTGALVLHRQRHGGLVLPNIDAYVFAQFPLAGVVAAMVTILLVVGRLFLPAWFPLLDLHRMVFAL